MKEILVVEGMRDVAELMATALESIPSSPLVHCFATPKEAIAYLMGRRSEGGRPVPALDLVLIDVEGSGAAAGFVQDILALPGMKHVPVIGTSFHCTELQAELFLAAGARAIQRKQVDYDKFAADLKVTVKFWLEINCTPKSFT